MGRAHSHEIGRKTNQTMEAEEKKSCDHYLFPLTELPDDILGEVFLRLPSLDLLRSSVVVCKKWRDIIRSQSLWKEKCKRDHCYTDAMLVTISGDFKELYFKNPYRSNLVKNPCAKEGFSHWKIVSNGGHGFRLEEEPCGSHPVKNFTNCDIDGPVGCWATSFGQCMKVQEIDLIDRGCSPKILDSVRPDICVSEWYAARFDCGCQYKYKVSLLNADKQVLDSYDFKDEKPSGRDWFSYPLNLLADSEGPDQTAWMRRLKNLTKMLLTGHVFSNYLPGCRYVKIVHGGQDANWWAGHYGVKITLSTVKFDFSHTAGPFQGDYSLPEQEKPKYDQHGYDSEDYEDSDDYYAEDDDYEI